MKNFKLVVSFEAFSAVDLETWLTGWFCLQWCLNLKLMPRESLSGNNKIIFQTEFQGWFHVPSYYHFILLIKKVYSSREKYKKIEYWKNILYGPYIFISIVRFDKNAFIN